jgi:hypothetical protein
MGGAGDVVGEAGGLAGGSEDVGNRPATSMVVAALEAGQTTIQQSKFRLPTQAHLPPTGNDSRMLTPNVNAFLLAQLDNQQLGNIIFNETRSMSGKGIGPARYGSRDSERPGRR